MPGPDVRGGDHQAGVLGGLQRELYLPGTGIRRGRGRADQLGQLGRHGGLGEPEAGTHRARRDLGAVPPRVQFRSQRGHFSFVLRRRYLEAGIGRGQGQHVPFGHRQARRGPAPPRGQQRDGQPGPRGGVDQRIQGTGQQRSGQLAANRPARRRHRRRQVMGPLRVGAAEHGAPPGRVGLTLVGEHGEHPATRGQVGGEARHHGQVSQRPARDADRIVLRPQLAEPAEHRERGGRPEGEHRHPPASQRHPTTPTRTRNRLQGLGAQEFRRGQRPAAERGKLQGQLVVDGLTGRVADRLTGSGPGPPRQQVGQLGRLAGERMRSRQPDIGGGRPSHGRQVRVLRPQAQRAVRPDPVNNPHALLPSGNASIQHANSGLAGSHGETPTATYLGAS